MKGGCGIEEKNVERDESQVAEDGVPNDGREKFREGVEDHGLGFLRWRCSCFDGAPLDAEVADYDLVAEQECLGYED